MNRQEWKSMMLGYHYNSKDMDDKTWIKYRVKALKYALIYNAKLSVEELTVLATYSEEVSIRKEAISQLVNKYQEKYLELVGTKFGDSNHEEHD